MKPLSKTSKYKECSTFSGNIEIVNKKYAAYETTEMNENEAFSNLKGKTKLLNKKGEPINCNDEPLRKFSKVSEYNPSELMSKLEEFSDVWNDCPKVKNPKLNSNYCFGDEGKSIENNEEESDRRKSSKNQKKWYTGTASKQLQTATEEHEKVSNSQKEHTSLKQYVKPYKNKQKLHDNSLKEFKAVKITSESQIRSKYDPKSADLKRIKAVQEHRQAHVEQKNIIKQALSSLDGKQRVNKKIVFDETEESCPEEHIDAGVEENKKAGRQRLFDESGDSDSDLELKLNHQFEGKKGQKLLELQSKFANDSRFTLDTRFCESGSDESETEHLESVNEADEKTKQLAILESIVQRQIKPLSELKKKSLKKNEDTLLLRFDPTREDHSKYIVKPQEPTKNEEKKDTNKRKKKEVIKYEQENKTQVSKDKFFAVKEDIKEVFKKNNGASTEFSLLKHFGTKDSEEPELKSEESKIPNKHKSSSKTPFKYDSSDTESDEDELKVSETEHKLIQGTEVKENINVKNLASSWKTTFFFTDNDPRLQEGMEFLKGPEEIENNEDYAEKRKLLKIFTRKKFKKNIRKRNPFKKKLGGVKKKMFKPKKRTS